MCTFEKNDIEELMNLATGPTSFKAAHVSGLLTTGYKYTSSHWYDMTLRNCDNDHENTFFIVVGK